MMKSIELIIRGRKVVDVGYRSFLLLNAMNRGIQEFYASNSGPNGKEFVVLQVQGEDDRITSFIHFIRSQYPRQKLRDINILGEVKEDTAAIRDDISVLRLDTLESLHEK
jgi:acylphosphatase